jgi:hypothetical protein
MARDIGGTGFVSLNDYLGANQGVLDSGYQQDYDQAHQLGDRLSGYLGQIEPGARSAAAASGAAPDSGSVAGYTDAVNAGGQAKEMGRRAANPFTAAGNPFDSALLYGAHGEDYQSLAGYLGGLGNPDDALAKGTQEGIADYTAAHQPPRVAPPPPEPESPYDRQVRPGEDPRKPPQPYTPAPTFTPNPNRPRQPGSGTF